MNAGSFSAKGGGASGAEPRPEFKRELRLLDSTMIVIGSMIGSGIFIVSADIARTVGSPGYLLLVWLITGAVTVIAALSYGELAGMMPHVGGQYAYLREAYNPLAGFLYGWTLFLVIQTGTIAAVAVAFAKFTAVLIPWFGETNIIAAVFGLRISAAQVLAIASIAALTYVNMRGLREGKIVQNIFTITKTLALVGLILLGMLIGRNAPAISANFSRFWSASWIHLSGGRVVMIESLSGMMLAAAIGVAMVGSLFSSDAWNNITFTAGEVVNPKRNIPLSLALGTMTVTILYLLANVSYILVLPLSGSPAGSDVVSRGIQFAADDRVATAGAAMIFGAPAAIIMAILIMISTFGCNNGLILAGARVYYAMAKDNVFFQSAGKLNDKAVPGTALVVQGIWASLLCLSGTYGDLLDYVIFAVLIFYIMTIAGIFILRKKRPEVDRPYRAFGYPIVPALYILAAAAISVDLLVFKPRYTWPGMIIVLLGIPVYFVWRNLSHRKVEREDDTGA
ncbi:MAG TPA: amino acid permease [Candidatus Acidoferrales bacterium]|nr:amino acid permease [Candidatus Acidoferrales bacterium]